MNGKQPAIPSTADEAVTFGATVHAAILSGNQDPTLKDVLLLDATLLSLGVKTADGMVTTVISRNTSTPTKKSQTFSTDTDNQTSVLIEVFEGERSMSYDNRLLGKLYLEDIPPMPRGEPQIDVSFDIDADGTLRVTADEKSTGKTNAITLKDIKDGILPASTAAKVTGQEYRVIRWHKSAHAPVVSDTETPWSVVTPPSAGEIDHNAPSTRGSQATSFDRPPPSGRKRKCQQTGAEDPSIRVKQQKMKAALGPTEATGGMPQALAAASSAQPVAPAAVLTAHLPVPTSPVVAETADHQTGVDRLVRTRATVGEVMNANSDAPSTSSAVGTSTPSEEEKHQDPPEQHSDNAGSTVWIGGTPLLQSVEVHMLRLVASVNRWRRRTDLPGGEEGSTTSSTSRPATNTSTNDTLRAELEKLRQSIATLQEDLHVATDWIVAHVTNHSGATQLVGDLGLSSFTASAGEDLLLMRSVEVDLLRLVTAVQRQLLATGIAESDSGSASSQSHEAAEQVPATSASRR
ncbi:hypothetical protein BBJ28_00026231 [Nothophytophthora sp. Chile5]|nr:hypothetical protein BBJ28_00026231 [Nothophytophthora sp. Chile5]